jgi:hypothetical protein
MVGPRDLSTAVLRFWPDAAGGGLPLTIGELMDGVRALGQWTCWTARTFTGAAHDPGRPA